jgi:hypothetical protein
MSRALDVKNREESLDSFVPVLVFGPGLEPKDNLLASSSTALLRAVCLRLELCAFIIFPALFRKYALVHVCLVQLYVCVCLLLSLLVCVRLCRYVQVCVCLRLSVYLYVCLCLAVSACVWSYVHLLFSMIINE